MPQIDNDESKQYINNQKELYKGIFKGISFSKTTYQPNCILQEPLEQKAQQRYVGYMVTLLHVEFISLFVKWELS